MVLQHLLPVQEPGARSNAVEPLALSGLRLQDRP